MHGIPCCSLFSQHATAVPISAYILPPSPELSSFPGQALSALCQAQKPFYKVSSSLSLFLLLLTTGGFSQLFPKTQGGTTSLSLSPCLRKEIRLEEMRGFICLKGPTTNHRWKGLGLPMVQPRWRRLRACSAAERGAALPTHTGSCRNTWNNITLLYPVVPG